MFQESIFVLRETLQIGIKCKMSEFQSSPSRHLPCLYALYICWFVDSLADIFSSNANDKIDRDVMAENIIRLGEIHCRATVTHRAALKVSGSGQLCGTIGR